MGSTVTSGHVVLSSLGDQGGGHMGKKGQELQQEFLGGIRLGGRENSYSQQACPLSRTNILTAKFMKCMNCLLFPVQT